MYENKQNERKRIQWRLLAGIKVQYIFGIWRVNTCLVVKCVDFECHLSTKHFCLVFEWSDGKRVIKEHFIVYGWSQYDGANIKQRTIGYGWHQNKEAKLSIQVTTLHQCYKSVHSFRVTCIN